jgi:accessory gene regulator B
MIILAISFIICLIFAPIESTKKELTKKEQWKEKSIALGIILIAVIFKSFLPEELFISVVYSLLVANVLVIFSVIKQN